MTSPRISQVWGTILLTITIFSLSLPAYAKYSGGSGTATVSAGAVVGSEPPFNRGVNVWHWLQVRDAQTMRFAPFKQDVKDLKSLGCDVIRLILHPYTPTSGPPDYTIEPLFFHFLDQIVDWCEQQKIHLILDNGWGPDTVDTPSNIDEVLVPIWSQMAERYQGRSTYLYYEIVNEPHGITDARWGQIQQDVIDAIRAVDRVHTIVVTGAGWGDYNNLRSLPFYADDNLIYTFHFYDPFVFTHQGASWTTPSLVALAGVPFPYGAGPMPACPLGLRGTWVESALASYASNGTVERVKELLDIAVRFRDERQVPVFCGELGVEMPNSDNDQRVYWHKVVASHLQENGIAWAAWCKGDSGLFMKATNELFEHDLNLPLLEALGLIPLPQTPFVPSPDHIGFDIYTDDMADDVRDASYVAHGILDFCCPETPAAGATCIRCTGFNLYNAIGFDFRPDKDLTVLVREDYVLDFWVRGDRPGARLEVQFVDTKTSDPRDHPWLVGAAVDQSLVAWDGKWHRVQIPLKSFAERGSSDNNVWFGPQGAFDWSAVDRFVIGAGYHDFVGMQFWFDDIRVLSSSTSMPPRNAYHPDPPDDARYAPVGVTLIWTPGLNAKLHYVYFGDDANTVSSATGGVPQAVPTYTPTSPLERGKTYYWRVDEFDGTATYKGDVWSFSTIPIIAIRDETLLGWWKLEDGYGATAVDFSGHENHGTIHYPNGGLGRGGSAWAADPERGVVLSFNGDDTTGTYVSAGRIPAMTLTNRFTWAFWARQDEGQGTEPGPGYDVILGNRHGGTASPLQFIKFTPATFEYYHDGYTRTIDYENIPSGVWVHHAVVKDAANLTYYRNGQLAGMTTTAATIDANPFYIGGDAAGERWRGKIADVRIYARALWLREVQQIMRGDLP